MRIQWYHLFVTIFPLVVQGNSREQQDDNASLDVPQLYQIEGKIYPLASATGATTVDSQNWQTKTRIHVNGGEYLGFVTKDGTFTVNGIPSGSYIVECLHPDYTYESVRVEINSKGKFRARKVNHIQTNLVIQVPYPLRLKAVGRTKYFQQREQWMITDFLFNPMVLMMVLPLVLVMMLPKMLNDPETKKEMEQIQNLTKFELPEMSDMVTNFLSGAGGSQSNSNNSQQQQTSNSKKPSKNSKKRQ